MVTEIHVYPPRSSVAEHIRLVLEGCGFESFFVTLLAADYKLTNNGYNEHLYEISTNSHEKRRENVIVTRICFPRSSVVERHQLCERKVMSLSSFYIFLDSNNMWTTSLNHFRSKVSFPCWPPWVVALYFEDLPDMKLQSYLKLHFVTHRVFKFIQRKTPYLLSQSLPS